MPRSPAARTLNLELGTRNFRSLNFALSVFGLLLDLGDVALGEEVRAHVSVEDGVDAAQVFQRHHGMLDLLVAVVREDAPELLVLRHLDALVIPVNGLQFLLQRLQRARKVERLLAHLLVALVPLCARSHFCSPSTRFFVKRDHPKSSMLKVQGSNQMSDVRCCMLVLY